MNGGRGSENSLRKAVGIVCALNLTYFFIELFIGLKIESVSLFADSVDFFEDAAVNLLIFLGLAWSATNRARLGKVLALILLLPVLAMIWSIARKFSSPIPPEPLSLTMAGAGALLVNIVCALILLRLRQHSGSLTKAAFLSARNDVLGNVAIIAAGLLTSSVPSHWPDLVVGLGIGFMNIDAAKEVWEASHEEKPPAP